MNYTKLLIIILLNLSIFCIQAQSNRKIDSLLKLISSEKTDTLKVRHLYKLCWEYTTVNPHEAKKYGERALNLAQKIGYKRGIAASLNNLGNIYYYADDYQTAISYYEKSLDIRKQINDLRGMSDNLNNLGVMYRIKGNYSKSLDYFLQSLKTDEKLKDTAGVAACYNNIGLIMSDLKNKEKAKEYYLLSIKTYELVKNHYGTGSGYNNLALLLLDQNQNDSALSTFEKALQQYQLNNDKYGIASCYFNMATINSIKSLKAKEKEFILKSLELRKEIEDIEGVSSCLVALAKIENDNQNHSKALSYLTEAISINKKIDNKQSLMSAYKIGAEIYGKNKDYFNAYLFHKQYSELRDSLMTLDATKSISDMQVKYETDKKNQEIQLLTKEAEIKNLEAEKKEHEISKQKTILFGFAIILLLVIGFAFMLVKSLREKQRAAIKLELAYSQIEEKNKHITDSINYAKRIQEAMLKDEDHTSEHLPPHFILFIPKDIVSGDFYWATEKDDYLYLAAADCTGHGVPGAFLTLLGTSFLNEITASDKIHTPAEILNLLREKIVKELSNNGLNKDGMDISMIRLNLKTKEALWAGAYNALWILRKEHFQLEEIIADKQPVGYIDNMRSFTDNSVSFNEGDQFYLFTDGLADQFGGPKGKKMKYKKVQETLLSIRNLSPENQKNELFRSFENWKGNLEQVDDILFIGFKIV